MSSFQLLKQEKTRKNFQSAVFSHFSIIDGMDDDADMVRAFISSEAFIKDAEPTNVKKPNNDEEPIRPFVLEQLRPGDFRKYGKEDIVAYLHQFSHNESWQVDDHWDDLKKVIYPAVKEAIANSNADSFYMIDLDWFEEFIDWEAPEAAAQDHAVQILRYPVCAIASYFFRIIWMNTGNKTLTLCEMIYD